jgi:hypothetical protein
MAVKTFRPAWVGVYRASSNSYYGGADPIMVGGSSDYQTFLGFPSGVRDAIKTSKTTPQLRFKYYVTDATPEWDLGRHRETYNKATGSMPWYSYIRAYQGWGTGWQTMDLTSNFMTDYKNGSYHGIVLYSSASSSYYGVAVGMNGAWSECVIEVVGDWNDPPGKPTITYPKGGEVADTEITFKWNSASDPDGDSLKYELGFYNGKSWATYTTTSASYRFILSDDPETTSAQFRIRAVDPAGLTSAWVYSNKFTVAHNSPPSAPTSLYPSNGKVIDRTQIINFSWNHTDDGAQAGFQLRWRTKSDTGVYGTWNYYPSSTAYANTTNEYWNAPAYTLPFSDIEWQVSTKDQQGLTSPFSSRVFKASNQTDAPTIIQPSNTTVNTSSVTIQWSSLNQMEYQVELRQGTTVLYSASGTGTTKTIYPSTVLSNNQFYSVWVRSKSKDTLLWSEWSSLAFTTAFTPPATPLITGFQNAGDGVLNMFYEVTNSTTAVQSVSILRRLYTPTDSEPWVFVAEGLTETGSYLDYTLASGTVYEFKVMAFGDNGTVSESIPEQKSIEFEITLLQESKDLSNVTILNYCTARDETTDIENKLSVFAGRTNPVREYGEHETTELKIDWEVDTFAEVQHFQGILRRRDVLLYRDYNGRRFWVTAGKLSIKDKAIQGFELSLPLTVTSYIEDITRQEG